MSLPESPVPILPSFSVIYSDEEQLEACLEGLKGFMGSPVLESGEYPFDMTDYYQAEMGSCLRRRWFCFSLADAEMLPEWKLLSIDIEGQFGGEGKRKVNIDPGYLDHGKLVLASCKPAPDKIYLSKGIYAHKCLRYRSGDFHAPDHSFDDFKDGRFNGFFIKAKTVYRDLLRVKHL